MLGRSPGPRRKIRLSQFPSNSPGPHRHNRLHDGLRYHRHRARSRPDQVQEAGRRRHDQDRQQHRAHRALQAGILPRSGRRHRQLHRRHRHHRRRAPHQGRAPRRLRLLLQAGQRHALHRLHGTPPHDGRRSALHLRRYIEDRQSSRERHRRRHHGSLPPGLEARPEGSSHLPRRLQEVATAKRRRHQNSRKLRSSRSGGRIRPPARRRRHERSSRAPFAIACRKSAPPSRTNSKSETTRATSPSASIPTASPASSSSPWRKKDRRSAASWTASP